jgi:hypothetical protein
LAVKACLFQGTVLYVDTCHCDCHCDCHFKFSSGVCSHVQLYTCSLYRHAGVRPSDVQDVYRDAVCFCATRKMHLQRNVAVSIATRYELNCPRIRYRCGRDIPFFLDRRRGLPSILYNGNLIFPGIKRRKRGADYISPYRSGLRMCRRYALAYLLFLHRHVIGWLSADATRLWSKWIE